MSEQKKPIAIVVEDDPASAGMISTLLAGDGYDVVRDMRGAGAINQIRELTNEGRAPALLITDFSLGGEMTGKEVIDEARKIVPTLPIVLTSAHTRGKIANEMQSCETAVDTLSLLQKPFRMTAFSEAINQAQEAARNTHAAQARDDKDTKLQR